MALLSVAFPMLLVAPAGMPPGTLPPRVPPLTAEDILERTRALYPTLQSYADSGTVLEDGGGDQRRGSFQTYYLAAAQSFFFEYRWDSFHDANGTWKLDYHLVFWMQRGELQTWDATARMHQVFPAGSDQVTPLRVSGPATREASILVPSLIYTKAQLPGPVQAFQEVTVAETEPIGGRPCHKLMGLWRMYYPSGKVAGVRPMTVWIDKESYLIRQVLLDTPKGVAVGLVNRLTFTYKPHLNPTLSDSLFTFSVPSAQQ